MRTYLFARRNAKEILREPLYFAFGLGFPLILLFLLSMIDASIPKEANNMMFSISNLAPGLALFGASFMSLFVGMLVAKDRTSSFLMRLFASPMKATDFILGYTYPILIMTIGQTTITLTVSLFFGLSFTFNFLIAILVTTIVSLLFIAFGLLCGSLLSDKAVGGVFGALITNLTGWFSGIFIPLDLIGGVFKTIAYILPFHHGVGAIKASMVGNYLDILPHLGVVLLYAVGIYAFAILIFHNVMNGKKN